VLKAGGGEREVRTVSRVGDEIFTVRSQPVLQAADVPSSLSIQQLLVIREIESNTLHGGLKSDIVNMK